MTSPSHSPRLHRFLFAPVDIGCLVFVRIVFGAAMLWEVCRYFVGDWISHDFIEPVMHFTYFGFDWVRPWPGVGMYIHFAVLGIAALCVLLGLFYRVAATVFFLGFTYVFLLDEALYLNHFYLVCLLSFLLIFVPAERAFSLDARRRPQIRTKVAPAWAMWLLRAQIGIAYFFGGIAKLNADWFQGEPLRAWLTERTDFPVIGQFFHEEWMVYMFVIGGVLLDLLVVPLMLWKPTRLLAFLAATSFHLLNARLFNIGVFPWLMLAATVV
ncbi:MAG: Vitamin k-dependent gamma-carboxylase, partial [Verrucomicrobiaceae bacterium]|nr:Vitamin k-dependent gamma-carboxylase [Verrucomicrobiaceae bacterium]